MDEILNDALHVDNAVPELVTPEQRAVLAMYLIDSAIEPPDFSFFDIDCVLFARFIEEAEKLTPSAKLALAISLLGEVVMDVMLLEQQGTQSVLRALVLKAGARS